MMWNMGYGFAGFGWLFMLIWWAVPILIIVVLVRWISGNNGSDRHSSALKILRERYAKGEIDEKEFKEKKRNLA